MGGQYQNESDRKRWESVDSIHVAQDREQWRALVNTVMNLRVQRKAGNFLTVRDYLPSEKDSVPCN
jgi:hypothetical protein